MLSTKLIIPKWLNRGITPNDKGARLDKYIYGGDTETYFGLPMTMQFYSDDCDCRDMFWVDDTNAADTFLKWCSKRRRNVLHVVYVHNLAFDLPEFLWGYHAKLLENNGDFRFTVGEWSISGVYGAPTFCRLSNGHDLTIHLVDSFSFYRSSLENAAALFCPTLPKLKPPKGLGSRKFSPRNETFCEYAMRDAQVDYHIGRALEKLHQKFDLKQTLSVADMAARIFRHQFLTYTIPQPSREITEAALCSSHGGKNNVTVKAGWYDGVNSLDISSAYPTAMHGMPAFSNANLYKQFNGRKVKKVPPYGVYCISGTAAPCDWPVIFSHGFKPLSGVIDSVWVQGFELNEALSSGEFKPTSVHGYYYDAEKDHQAPAFRQFVETFYELKESEQDDTMRQMFKFILNAVSGKFIQTIKHNTCAFTDVDAGVTVNASELVAGGMFHSFIYSAITAHTRAGIHQMEHEYKAIHTATDGIMTLDSRAQARGKGLGATTLEARDGELLLWRNKCYVLYTPRDEKLIQKKKQFPSDVFKGKYIRKYAKHGFQGSVTQLETLAKTGARSYQIEKPNKLKSSVNRGLVPNLWQKHEFTLNIGPLETNPGV